MKNKRITVCFLSLSIEALAGRLAIEANPMKGTFLCSDSSIKRTRKIDTSMISNLKSALL